MIAFGTVVAVDEKGVRVRVEFPDRDDGEAGKLLSGWLPVVQKKTLGDMEYWLPDEGTQVVCLMDGRFEEGAVMGAIYSDADPAPVASKELFYRRFKDGSTIIYDREQHKLTVDVKGTVEASAEVSATVTAPEVTVVAATKVKLDTPVVEVTGRMEVAGNVVSGGSIQATGNVSDAGGAKTMSGMRATFNAHTHSHPADGQPIPAPAQGM